MGRIGAPYDLYSLGDLERVDPSNYKLFLFLNTYSLTDQQRNYINQSLKQKGKSLFFVGNCDFMDKNGANLKQCSELVEMPLQFLETEETTVRAFHSEYGYQWAKKPTLFVEEAGVRVLGRFSDSRKCALSLREKGEYRIFFSAVGNLSHTVLREIAKASGVHIYAENGVFTYINDALCGIYNTAAEETTVTLRRDGVYREIFTGKLYRTENRRIALPTGKEPAQMLILSSPE